MTQNTTTTTPAKVAKGKRKAPPAIPARRKLPWPREELAALVKELTGGEIYEHGYLSDLARGIRKNGRLAETIEKAAEILNKRHSIRK